MKQSIIQESSLFLRNAASLKRQYELLVNFGNEESLLSALKNEIIITEDMKASSLGATPLIPVSTDIPTVNNLVRWISNESFTAIDRPKKKIEESS
mmetsp:Transcript_33974/g.37545  ORF Transcript_33974/g.37545 Transcript_33974/m.37545 type:complete len:96 (-) Transcript_33974:126-413(-)